LTVCYRVYWRRLVLSACPSTPLPPCRVSTQGGGTAVTESWGAESPNNLFTPTVAASGRGSNVHLKGLQKARQLAGAGSLPQHLHCLLHYVIHLLWEGRESATLPHPSLELRHPIPCPLSAKGWASRPFSGAGPTACGGGADSHREVSCGRNVWPLRTRYNTNTIPKMFFGDLST